VTKISDRRVGLPKIIGVAPPLLGGIRKHITIVLVMILLDVVWLNDCLTVFRWMTASLIDARKTVQFSHAW